MRDEEWTGEGEIVARFAGANGAPLGGVTAQTATFRLLGDASDPFAAEIHHELHLQIPPKAAALKLLVGILIRAAWAR